MMTVRRRMEWFDVRAERTCRRPGGGAVSKNNNNPLDEIDSANNNNVKCTGRKGKAIG